MSGKFTRKSAAAMTIAVTVACLISAPIAYRVSAQTQSADPVADDAMMTR